jgi:hypothetical protein
MTLSDRVDTPDCLPAPPTALVTAIERVGEIVGTVLAHRGVPGGGPQIDMPQPS